MRWYRLKIGNEVFEGGKSSLLKNLVSNSAEINISFNIQIFESNSASIIGTIQLFNVSLEWFLLTQSKKDLDITLEAGFSDDSPLVKKCKYSKATATLLLSGKIQNIIGDFNDIQSVVTIYYVPYSKRSDVSLDLKLKIENGDKVANKIINFLSNHKDLKTNSLACVFNATSEAKSLKYSGGSIQIIGNSLSGFLKDCEKIKFKKKDKQVNLKHTISNYGECLLYSDISEIKGANHTIEARDFIQQPQMLDFSGSLQCIIKLAPEFKVGDIVSIAGTTPAIQGAYTNIKALTPSQDTTKLFYTGKYIVKSVNHMGEFYNIASDSWTTQLECVPTDETITTLGLTNA